ncbi:MAG: LPS export ABC transporter ATP-binding protein [bacterium]|nr:LPS export ABC transporter ATP-binding protein [bacterium]
MKLKGCQITKFYGKRRVVNGVDVEVREGEVVGLLGPNGAGKTTTFYCITGLISANSGGIFIDDEEITDLPMYRRAQKGIGYLPQEPSVFLKLTVRENILAILEFIEKNKKKQKEKTEDLLSEFGLTALANQLAYTLSGGERRRLEIARALSVQPRFILLDEPFLGVDPIRVEEIQEIINKLKEKGLGVLITDHNVRETLRITDRSYIIADGKILIEGTADFLVANSEARRIYLGERFRLD